MDGNVDNSFRIDSKTSSIYLNQRLDYEALSIGGGKTFKLNVSATDGGIPPKTAFIGKGANN